MIAFQQLIWRFGEAVKIVVRNVEDRRASR